MLELEGVRISYGSHTVVDDLDWSVGADGLVTALLGPSGCGKSTLIRAIAGLEDVERGSIRLDGNDLVAVPAHRRDFGVVFQDGQLFGGRSVGANVAYGLKARRMRKARIAERVTEMLELVQLPGFERRPVDELSGGQAQRVALARALAPHPRLLLLDEPLAALDRRLRDELALDIGRAVRATDTPTILVTHDHTEAALVADAISVMRSGDIVQTSSPARLWKRPVDGWTARFLGCTTVLSAQRDDGVITTPLGVVDAGALGVGDDREPRELGLRAESVYAKPIAAAEYRARDRPAAEGEVVAVADLPAGQRVRVSTPVGEIDAVSEGDVRVGDTVVLRLRPEHIAVVGP